MISDLIAHVITGLCFLLCAALILQNLTDVAAACRLGRRWRTLSGFWMTAAHKKVGAEGFSVPEVFRLDVCALSCHLRVAQMAPKKKVLAVQS